MSTVPAGVTVQTKQSVTRQLVNVLLAVLQVIEGNPVILVNGLKTIVQRSA